MREVGVVASSARVHCAAVKNGFSFGGFCGAALVKFYARCSCLGDAHRVFGGITCPHSVLDEYA